MMNYPTSNFKERLTVERFVEGLGMIVRRYAIGVPPPPQPPSLCRAGREGAEGEDDCAIASGADF